MLPLQLPRLAFNCARCGAPVDFDEVVCAEMLDFLNNRWVEVVLHADRDECERELS